MRSKTRGKLTIFEYLYRDAANFKSYGSILLSGQITQSERDLIEGKLESGEFFIAEQIGVKPLYEALYEFSGGMVEQDHVWHSFGGFREVTDADRPDEMKCWGTTSEFTRRFARVDSWNLQLSRHAVLAPSRA